jgi:hypothetical protein
VAECDSLGDPVVGRRVAGRRCDSKSTPVRDGLNRRARTDRAAGRVQRDRDDHRAGQPANVTATGVAPVPTNVPRCAIPRLATCWQEADSWTVLGEPLNCVPVRERTSGPVKAIDQFLQRDAAPSRRGRLRFYRCRRPFQCKISGALPRSAISLLVGDTTRRPSLWGVIRRFFQECEPWHASPKPTRLRLPSPHLRLVNLPDPLVLLLRWLSVARGQAPPPNAQQRPPRLLNAANRLAQRKQQLLRSPRKRPGRQRWRWLRVCQRPRLHRKSARTNYEPRLRSWSNSLRP